MIEQTQIPLYDQLVGEFDRSLPLISQSEPEALVLTRKAAFDKFRTAGFPSTRLEDWKHTNILPFLKEEFNTTAESRKSMNGDTAFLRVSDIKGLDCYKLVLLNGRLIPELSILPEHPQVKIAQVADVKNDPAFLAYFDRDSGMKKHAFAALNTAFFSEGLFIEIGSRVTLDKPLHIIHVFSAEVNKLLQARHMYVVNEHASADIIESTVNHCSAGLLVNSVTEIHVKEQARLGLYAIQSAASGKFLQHTEVSQQAYSNFSSNTYSFPGAAFIRNNLHIGFEGEFAEGNLYGLYLAGKDQLVDNHTLVDHRLPNCNSNEWYKGMLLDSAAAVFNGKIKVHRDAQKTNAFQKNNNILISQTAKVNTKPELEIYADDVKCSHGCTIGQFNEDALFYLKSRGIGQVAATGMLMEAFAFDVTSKVKIPELQEHIRQLIGKWLVN